ncbi:MAG: YggS family pyridoxal phosphate-dependent enzyme [Opitutales bacterium]|nr:YggS family pyridoxal phosphate-dependent enzyme [Opitutales bacterium]
MISEAEFRKNLEILQEQLASVCVSANRNIEDVQILPVTKNWPIEAVHFAQRAGFSRVGENRVQEAIEKQEGTKGINWDLIGHLQSNKAKLVAGRFSRVQTVDSNKVVNKLNQALEKSNDQLGILIQVNTGKDPAKAGVTEEQSKSLLEEAMSFSTIKIEGLMTIAPFAPNQPSIAREAFSKLRILRDKLSSQFNLPLTELSMGMSGDLEEAVLEGSTMIRVGSGLFGHRS